MRVKKNKIWFLSILLVGLISTVFLNNLNFENDFNNISVKSFDDNFSNLQLSSPSDKNWWDSSYKYRTPINITNKHTGDLPKGYSVNISVNTSNLFSNGKLRSDGKDLRIVWYNSSSETWLELDRVNDTNFNTANTQILFKTQTSISPSADDTNYYLYYGFEAANDPPTNKSKVYDFFDDFTQGDGDADGWTVSSGTWSVINNEYRQNQLSFDRRTILDTYTVENATIKVRIKHIGVGTMFGGGVMFRYSSGGNFYTSGLGFWGDEVGTGRWTSGNPLQLDGTGTELDLIEDNWYDFRIEMLGNQYDVYLNDSLKNSVTNTDHLNPGQIGFMTYTNQLAVYFDDLKIGLLVATPPILTTGTEEIYGSWFNKNWNYYKKITVTASSVTIPSDYTISLNFDHESLVSAGKSRVDGDDVRIVYWNGSDWEELDRMLDPSSSWNSNSTKIWFKTQAAIAASSFDNNYYLYYSNSFASSPPSNSDNIFFFYDGFESGDLYGWDGNSTGSAGDLISASTDQAYTGNYAAKCEMDVVASPQAMVYEDFPDEMNMIARVPIYLDPSLFITDRLTVIQFVDTSPGWQNLMSVTIDQDMTLYMWNAVVGEAYGYGGGSTISTGTWHTLEFQLKISETAGVARLWLNDSLEIEATSINVSTEGIDKFATGIYWAGDNEPNTVYIDDIYLRVGVDTEPATSLGVEEMFRPSINDFNYYKEITIDHTKVSGSSSLINFPVLISILDTDLYDKVQSTGSDIAFYNGTHWLDHEIELFNQTYSGTEAQLVVWVRIPSLSPTTDTKIYMYYGNSTIGPQENPTGVWDSNYKAVWHLSEDPSGSAPQILDSTLNNYDGTSYGSMTSGDQIAGQIDGSLDFDGSDDEIRLPGVVIGDLAAWTISAWIRMGADTADQRTIYSEGDTGEVEYLFLYVDDTNSEVKFYSETATGDYAQATGSTDVEDNQWHLVTLVQRSRIDRELYVDSLSEDNSTDNAGTLTTDTASIGALNTIWSADWFNGTIDEVRISNIDRSNDWIATQYNNQYDPDSFYTIGDDTGPSVDDFDYYKEITIDHTKISGSSNLIDFPVLISILDTDLHDDVQSNGNDIAFYNGTDWLDHEIEVFNQTYSGTQAQLVAWVRVPSLSPSTDTIIYMYYGNSTMSAQENPTGVWDDNYIGVWHLAEDPTGTVYDSTSNNNNGTSYGSMNSADQVSGKIDGSLEFDGDNDYIDCDNDSSLDITGDITIEFWVNGESFSNDLDPDILTKGSYTQAYSTWINDDGSVYFQLNGDSLFSTYKLSLGNWYKVVCTRSGSNRTIYINGTNDISDSFSSTIETITETLTIARSPDNLNGTLDEIRLSNVARSHDWIATEFENQNEPDSFYSIGIENQVGEDTSPPDITINSPNPNDLFGASAPDYDLTVVDANLDSIWYSLDGGANSTPVSASGTIDQTMWSVPPNGTVTLRFYANDTVGNLNFTEIVVRKDFIAPAITINSPNTNDLYGDNAPSYDLTVVDGNLDSIWYSLDGGTTNSTPVSATGTINLGMWSGRPNGTVTLRFYANDTMGNVNYEEVVVRKDIIAPAITINSPNTNDLFGNNAPSYDLTVVDGNLASIWYSLDGGTTNSTPVSATGTINLGMWSGRPNGTVTIRFYANDTMGNVNYEEVVVRKDIILPLVDITIPAPDGAQMGGSIISISGIAYGTGSNIVSIYINDTRWGDGSQKPQTDPSGSQSGAFVFNNNTNIVPGFYWIEINITDAAGNINTSLRYFEVIIEDTTPPILIINSIIPDPTNGYTVITIISNEDLKFLPLLNITLPNSSVIYRPMILIAVLTWSANYTVDADGIYTVRINGTDDADNVGYTIDTFEGDITAPSITINIPNLNDLFGITAPSYDLTVADANLDSIWYSLDGGITNSTPVSAIGTINLAMWSGRPNGTVTIRFYANDTVGNVNYEEVVVRKDIIDPAITINSPNPNDLFGITAPSYDLTVADGNLDSIWYSLDGGITNSTPVSAIGTINLAMWSGRPNGTVTIRFYANDTVGNVNYEEVVVRKDIIAPAITINSPNPNDLFGTNAPSYDLSVVDGNLDSIWYSLDGGTTNSTPVSAIGTINLAMWSGRPNGTVTIRFYANDTMGNVNYEEVVVRKDIFFPIITINTPNLNDAFNSTAPSFIVSISGSNLDTSWYTLDDGLTNYTFTGLNGTINQSAWDVLGDGTRTIKFFINNTLGVIGFDEITVIRDTLAPQITINLPLNNTYCGIAPIINILATDANLDAIWYKINTINIVLGNNINQQLDDSIWDSLPEGEFYVYIYANDSVSQLSDPIILILYKDTIAPSAPIFISFPQGEVSGTLIFEWQEGSDPSGISKYRLIIDNEANPFATPGFVYEVNITGSYYEYTGTLQPGTYYFFLFQIDGTDHQSLPSTGSFSIRSSSSPSQPPEFPLWIIIVIIGAAIGGVVGFVVLKKSKSKKVIPTQTSEKMPEPKPKLEIHEELKLMDYEALKDKSHGELKNRKKEVLGYIKYLEQNKDYTKAAEFAGELIIIEDILGNSQEIKLYRQKQIDIAITGLEYLKDQYEIESKNAAISGDYSKALDLYNESKLISENLKVYIGNQESSNTEEEAILEAKEPQLLIEEIEIVYSCINDLLTKYFDDMGIKYYSNPQIYDDVQNQIHGLILTDNKLLIADIDPSIRDKIKSIQIIYTRDVSNENIIKLSNNFLKPDVVLIIVGIEWSNNIEAQTIEIPPHRGINHQENIRIIHYELFSSLIGLKDNYEIAFNEIINLYYKSQLDVLQETHESSEIIIHSTDELLYDLKEKGLIKQKLQEYFHR